MEDGEKGRSVGFLRRLVRTMTGSRRIRGQRANFPNNFTIPRLDKSKRENERFVDPCGHCQRLKKKKKERKKKETEEERKTTKEGKESWDRVRSKPEILTQCVDDTGNRQQVTGINFRRAQQ